MKKLFGLGLAALATLAAGAGAFHHIHERWPPVAPVVGKEDRHRAGDSNSPGHPAARPGASPRFRRSRAGSASAPTPEAIALQQAIAELNDLLENLESKPGEQP
jgi:hypothetical protein